MPEGLFGRDEVPKSDDVQVRDPPVGRRTETTSPFTPKGAGHGGGVFRFNSLRTGLFSRLFNSQRFSTDDTTSLPTNSSQNLYGRNNSKEQDNTCQGGDDSNADSNMDSYRLHPLTYGQEAGPGPSRLNNASRPRMVSNESFQSVNHEQVADDMTHNMMASPHRMLPAPSGGILSNLLRLHALANHTPPPQNQHRRHSRRHGRQGRRNRRQPSNQQQHRSRIPPRKPSSVLSDLQDLGTTSQYILSRRNASVVSLPGLVMAAPSVVGMAAAMTTPRAVRETARKEERVKALSDENHHHNQTTRLDSRQFIHPLDMPFNRYPHSHVRPETRAQTHPLYQHAVESSPTTIVPNSPRSGDSLAPELALNSNSNSNNDNFDNRMDGNPTSRLLPPPFISSSRSSFSAEEYDKNDDDDKDNYYDYYYENDDDDKDNYYDYYYENDGNTSMYSSSTSHDPIAQALRMNQRRELTEALADILQRQDLLIRLCKCFIRYGAPSHRIELAMEAMCRTFGIVGSFVFLPGLMMISFGDTDTHTSETHLIKCAQGFDMGRLAKVHRMTRSVVYGKMEPGEALAQLKAIQAERNPYPRWVTLGSYAVCSGLFAPLVFKGSWYDMVAGMGLGCVVGLTSLLASRYSVYSDVFEVSTSIVIAFVAKALREYVCFTSVVLSGIVMLLPGLSLTTSIMELSSRSMISGSVRMFYSLIYCLFLGFGLSIGSNLWDAFKEPPPGDLKLGNCHSATEPWRWILFPFLAIAFNIQLQAQPRQWPVMVVCSAVGYAVSEFAGLYWPHSLHIAAAVSAFVVGLLGNIYERLTHELGKEGG
ncbi:hypothetical protein BGZ94_001868 [Podila epigama]|nr:hypothetical protein BGZ94_001868 [Podila epigama]